MNIHNIKCLDNIIILLYLMKKINPIIYTYYFLYIDILFMSIFRILKYRYNYYHTNFFVYNILMFLAVLLSPVVFLTCFILPFVGTIFSREHSAKWVAFWLFQIIGSWTLIPFFELFFEC